MKLRANKVVIMLVGLAGLIPLALWLVMVFQFRNSSWSLARVYQLVYDNQLPYALMCIAAWLMLRTQAIGLLPMVAALAAVVSPLTQLISLLRELSGSAEGIATALLLYGYVILLLLAALVFIVQWVLAKHRDSDSWESAEHQPTAPKAAVLLLGVSAMTELGIGVYLLAVLRIGFDELSYLAMPYMLLGGVCGLGWVALRGGYRYETLMAWMAAVVGFMGSVRLAVSIASTETLTMISFLSFLYAPPLLAAGVILLRRKRQEKSSSGGTPCH